MEWLIGLAFLTVFILNRHYGTRLSRMERKLDAALMQLGIERDRIEETPR